MCKLKARLSILKKQSNIALKPASGMQRYALTKNKHLMSLKAVRSLNRLCLCGIYLLTDNRAYFLPNNGFTEIEHNGICAGR